MVRNGVAVGLSVAAALTLGALLGRTPVIPPAAAQTPTIRQVDTAVETFAFSATVPPGGTVVFDRAPDGLALLVTDVLVQNVPVGGTLADTPSLSLADKTLVMIGTATRQGIRLAPRNLGAGLIVRTSGKELERVHLTTGFVPVATPTGDVRERLTVFNSGESSATAFVQIYGRLIAATAP
jgi:hypothetical protein